MKRLRLFFILLFSVSSLGLIAQEKSFNVDINHDTIVLGKSVHLQFSLENIGGKFIPPSLDSCLVRKPSQQSRTTIINGKRRSNTIYNYLITPLKTGKFIIPPATVKEQQDSFRTDPLTIIVIADPDNPDKEILPIKPQLEDTPPEDSLPKKKKKLPPKRKVIRI